VIAARGKRGSGVEHEMVRGAVEGAGHFAEDGFQCVGELLDFLVADAVEIGALALG